MVGKSYRQDTFCKLVTSLVNLKANEFFKNMHFVYKTNLLLFFSVACRRLPTCPLIVVKLDIGTISIDHVTVDWR